jgi:hypothetical protein
MRRLFLSALCVAVTSVAYAQPPVPPTRTETVDCDSGDTINDALKRPNVGTIELRGFCREHVDIRRPIIIRGTDPSIDGIDGTGVVAAPNVSLVQVVDVQNNSNTSTYSPVWLENIGIRNGSQTGLVLADAEVHTENVVLSGNFGHGAFLTSNSTLRANNTMFSNNRLTGADVRGSARLACVNCVFSGNGATANRYAVEAAGNGQVNMSGGSITGRFGLSASNAQAVLAAVPITTTVQAVLAFEGARMTFNGASTIAGDVRCGLGSSMQFPANSNTQLATTPVVSASTGFNVFHTQCMVAAFQNAVVSFAGGQTYVTHRASIAATVSAQLTLPSISCQAGGAAAVTETASIVVGGGPVPAACAP